MVSLTNFRSVSELASLKETDAADNAHEPPKLNQGPKINAKQATPNDEPLEKQPDRLYMGEPEKHSKSHQKDPFFGSNKREHFEIRWSNLTYQVEPKWYRQGWKSVSRGAKTRGKTNILNNLNGSVKSGQVTAILGPSGAGKTSLLGCLIGKHKSGVSGCVQVISERTEPMSICTIPQKDFLLNQLTVRENLSFASRLKHPDRKFDHDSNIERVIELLKLESCIDTKISKISGGQHKRVSIAQELLSNPDILILDEPTSGLDSLTCYKTVMVLRDLARRSPNPMAIIVTIHQPQREVFDLFNHVYILAVGGRCIYEGQPSMSIKTINEYGGGIHFDADSYNPASYLVEIASSEFGEKPIECLVEHQRNEFRRLGSLPDGPGTAHLGTPGLKKRQSPMVARFKSTLSSLANSNGPSPLFGNRAQVHVINNSNTNSNNSNSNNNNNNNSGYAYTNEAFDSNQSLSRLDPSQLLAVQEDPDTADTFTPQLGAKGEAAARPDDHRLMMSANGDPLEAGAFYLDERLQTHKHDHKGHFFRHCQLLTKRSWLCLCKDPMLTTLRFSAHIIVPLLITLVYGSRVGRPNACPLYETEMDLIDYARNGPKRLMVLQEELRCTFENVGLFFLSIYAFTFSTMCLTSLSFPLNMHVLLKEVRNGWYSIPTYFIGKTLADFPLEFILPAVTLVITYPLTGQPSSYLGWRFLSATSVFVITSLIAQTQGLIFGALFMNAMQAAVFVAPVSTTPLILLSGFLIRISQMPVYLQKLSSLSYFRYAIESLTIIRYGFGQCPCDPSLVTGEPVRASGVPEQLRTMTNYWLSTFDTSTGLPDSFDPQPLNETLINSDIVAASSVTDSITTSVTQPEQQVDFFQDLTVLLARANSFGAEIKTCQDLKPYPMIDFSLRDDHLYTWLAALVATLFISKVVNYVVVKYSVKWRL